MTRLWLGRTLPNFLITLIPFMSLAGFSFKWWLSINFSFKNKPRCFWTLPVATTASSKWINGWACFIVFLEKLVSWACLFRLGLNLVFYLYAHSNIFFRSLLRAVLEISVSWTVDNLGVSSAKRLTDDTKWSGRNKWEKTVVLM